MARDEPTPEGIDVSNIGTVDRVFKGVGPSEGTDYVVFEDHTVQRLERE